MNKFKIIISVEENGNSKISFEPDDIPIHLEMVGIVLSTHAKLIEREIIINAAIERSKKQKVQLFQNMPSLQELKKQ